jgi:putative oxidoreductase
MQTRQPTTQTIVRTPVTKKPQTPQQLAEHLLARFSTWLNRYSVDLLRLSLGFVFLLFGVLKFFPGVSPAEALVERTIDTMTLGIVSGRNAVLLTAVMETFIGLTLLTGKLLRLGLVVLAGAFVGIMSPLVLFAGDLFPAGGPTIEAQYVIKDVILIAAALVVAAKALGARLVTR